MKKSNEMEYCYISVPAKGNVKLISVESDHFESFHELQNMCDGVFEIVRIPALSGVRNDLRMIVNETGKMRKLPLNDVATGLYANPYDCIVGDVGIVTVETIREDDEPDVYPLPLEDGQRLLKFLQDLRNVMNASK